MKTLLAALIIALATPAFAVQIDPVAAKMCDGQKDARLCAFKLSGCVDDVSASMSAKGEDYSVTMATYYHCAEKQKLRIRVTEAPNALGMIR